MTATHDSTAMIRRLGTARLWLFVSLLLATVTVAAAAHAQDAGTTCERNWGCWDLVYTSPQTVLGVTGTATLVHGGTHGDVSEGGVLTSYSMEHFGTKQSFSAHALAQGAIGGGSMGTEGSLRGELDLGLRLPVSEVSGPFFRGGTSAWVLGNHELYFSVLEPLRLRAGYQVLDGELLLEIGITGGVLAAGRFDPGPRTARSLARSPEVGGYVALHFSGFAVDAGVMHLPAEFTAPGKPVDVGHAELCAYAAPAALCAQVLSISGQAEVGHADYRFMRALHLGLTVGLTP